MSSHSRLSPSSSARWLDCTASVQAIEDDIEAGILKAPKKDDDGGPHALWGTRCHLIGEMILLGKSEEEIIKEVPQAETDEEMVDTAVEYADYVRGLMRKGSVLFVEQRVTLSRWIPDALNDHGEMEEQGGTADAIIIHTDRSMDVIDLKGGIGVYVEVKDNSQLKIYAGGALEEFDMLYDIDKVRTHVVQPRRDNIAFEEYKADDILHWMKVYVESSAKAIEVGHPVTTFAPSEKGCQWCPRSGHCDMQREVLTEMVLADFEDLDNQELSDPQKLTIAQMTKIYTLAPQITKFLKDVEARLLDRCKNQLRTTGIKMVEAPTKRKWADNDGKIAKALIKLGVDEKEVWNSSVISITDAEKIVGKGKLNAHITKPIGGLTVALVSDSRPAIKDVIEDLGEEDE